ncbi:MAG: VWA domain-containing protein [Granulosicoccus sp.]
MGNSASHSGTTDKPANSSAQKSNKRSPTVANDKPISNSDGIDSFLSTVKNTPPATVNDSRGRLIFALDATASRQSTWDRATSLQGDMFTKTRGLGALDIQLVYYRGYRECRSSKWISQPEKLLDLMKKVNCEAGKTQIVRILKHALSEARLNPVHALVFIGDCAEESIDVLGDFAGKLRISGLPVFIFQEGHDANASYVFAQIAKISGGAHCRFDSASAMQLGELLNAVAVYAAGGNTALRKLSRQGSEQATIMLEQMKT